MKKITAPVLIILFMAFSGFVGYCIGNPFWIDRAAPYIYLGGNYYAPGPGTVKEEDLRSRIGEVKREARKSGANEDGDARGVPVGSKLYLLSYGDGSSVIAYEENGMYLQAYLSGSKDGAIRNLEYLSTERE